MSERVENRKVIWMAGLCGLLGVGLGALGGHGLEEMLEKADRVDDWRTATRYLLIHAVAALLLGLHGGGRLRRLAGLFFAIGGFIFGGSLYLICLTGVTKWGAVTPVGGLLLLVAWLLVFLSGVISSKPTANK